MHLMNRRTKICPVCLQNSLFCGLGMAACRGSGGGVWRRDPVPLYLSFHLYVLPLPLLLPFFFLFNQTVSICDMIPKTMKTKCVERLVFFEIWCQKAFGKIPDSSKYRKSDQVLLCERLLPFWSLQKRRKLLSCNTFLAEVGCQENHPYGNTCIQK